MKKFDTIHNTKKPINENSVSKEDWISAFKDLRNAMDDKKHKMYSIIGKGRESGGDIAKDYYSNAIQMANDMGLIDAKLRRKINKANKEFANLGGKPTKDIIVDNINMILGELNENSPAATLGSVNGAGAVQLPSVDGGIGSGDVPGGTAELGVSTQKPAKKIAMKKFEKVKENRKINEAEIYIPITDFADPATLISVLAKELSKRSDVKETEVQRELANIEISYNGVVNIFTLEELSNILGEKPKIVKKKLDKLINDNIGLLENMQVELLMKILENPESLNEGILGRVLGGVAGFALGPTVGKLIAKVLGITKGPLYNLLTSRIVSAALAQELTKNVI